MKRKGDMVFWEISELTTTKEKLEELGFGKLVPRNDYKSAMIKALKKVTKGNDKLYRRFADGDGEVSFAVFEQVEMDKDIKLNREISITIDKKTGALSCKAEHAGAFYESIKSLYLAEKTTIDSSQLRSLILKLVQQECNGIAMRQGGGIYYIKSEFDETQKRLNALFNAFPQQARLSRVPVYNDPSTEEAIEHATVSEISGDIESLLADIEKRFKDGTITHKQLDGDYQRIQKIMDKANIHADSLRAKSVAIKAKLELAKKAVKTVTDKVREGIIEPVDFMKAMGEL